MTSVHSSKAIIEIEGRLGMVSEVRVVSYEDCSLLNLSTYRLERKK